MVYNNLSPFLCFITKKRCSVPRQPDICAKIPDESLVSFVHLC